MNFHFSRRRRILIVAMLAGFLILLTGGVGRAQTRRTPELRLSENEARQLRTEGDRYFESGKFSEALAAYLRVYANYRDTFEINQRIAWIYLNAEKGQWREALPYLRRAHHVNPADVGVLRDLARLTARARLFNESVPLYGQLVQMAPSVPDYLLEYARVLSAAGQDAEAVRYYNTILGQRPSDMQARLELGRLLGQQKDFTGAMTQYNYVLRFQPANLVARVRLAQIKAWIGQLQESLDDVENILKAHPEDFNARVVKAFDLLWLGQVRQAQQLFGQLAKENPADRDVQEGLKTAAEQQQAKVPAPPAPAPPKPAPPKSVQLAAQSEAEGRYSEAITYYRDYLAEFPDDSQAQYRLARVLAWDKQYAESESMLRDWTKKNPDDSQGHFQLGRVLAWEEKFQEAAEEYRKGLALSPQDPAAHLDLARVLAWAKDFPEAIDEYRTTLVLQPDSADAQGGLTQTLVWSGDFALASKELDVLRRKHPDDPQIQSLNQQIETLEVRRARAQGNFGPEVEQHFRSEVESDPSKVEARLLLADISLDRKDFPAAIKELRASADLKPDDDSIRLKLARVLSWNREFPESVRLYREWLSKHPGDQEVELQVARILSWGGNYDASIAEYHKLLAKNPKNKDTLLGLASVLSWSGRNDEALRQYDAVLQQDPKNFDALLGKGRLFSYQSHWRESREALDTALSIRPEDPAALATKARTLLWSGSPARARQILSAVRAENPADVSVLISLASAENALQRPDRALRLLDEAAQAQPNNRDVQTLREQIEANLRPELQLGWGYTRDTETLNIWRYRALDFRFNLHPRIRQFLTVDVLPTSGRANVFGYPVFTPSGTIFARRVPIDPFIPSPTLLSASDFPEGVLRPGNVRIRQNAVQFQTGATMQVNRWFSWTAGAGFVELRHGSPDLDSTGFPSTRTRFIYTASPTFYLGRHWQFSLGSSREYWTYTPRSISETVHVDVLSASVTWLPDLWTRIALSYNRQQVSPPFLIPTVPVFNADFTQIIGTFEGRTFRLHGNGGNLTATRTLFRREKFNFEAGYTGRLFGYTHPSGLPGATFFTNAGVFTPRFYQRHAALVSSRLKLSRYLNWDFQGTAGAQQIGQGSDFSFSSTAGTGFDFRLSPSTTLRLGYDYFNAASAFQTLVTAGKAPAYHSNSVSVTLRFHF